MLSPDPTFCGSPQFLRDVELLPNQFALSDTAERKIPKHIINEVENLKALSKNRTRGRGSILLGPEKPMIMGNKSLECGSDLEQSHRIDKIGNSLQSFRNN